MSTRNFRQLMEEMPPARRERVEKRFQESIAAMPLDALRTAREMTQLQVGEVLGVHEGEVLRTCEKAPIADGTCDSGATAALKTR